MGTKIIEKKKQKVAELQEKLDSASVIVVSGYRGFTVKEITELRKNLRNDESELKIYKNTLIERAMDGAGFSDLKEHLSGPVALLLGYKDPVMPLKTLVNFVNDNEKGEIKAGVIEKAIVKKEQVLEVAKLPSREKLLGKVVGSLQSPLYGLVNVLQGTIRNLVYALNDLAKKKPASASSENQEASADKSASGG